MSRRQSSLKLPLPAGEFSALLLRWYRRQSRALPWREDRSPYRVWVSEIMLQQTTVKAVLPYYERFLTAFPSLRALASASLDEVLSLWAGLGYYSRARNLHRAAQVVCESFEGNLPRDYGEISKLPGIGRYTAGAILSVAYGLPFPVLDGNVRRLFVRYTALDTEPGAKLDRELWDLLEQVVDKPDVAREITDFNQALMEMGALVCIPRSPRCGECPLLSSCQSAAQGLQDVLPRPRKRPKIQHLHYRVAVIASDGRFLLRRSSGDSFLSGFWEFPKLAGPPGSNDSREFRQELGLELAMVRELPRIQHQITFRKLTFHPYLCGLLKEPDRRIWDWGRMGEPGRPVSAYVRRIAEVALATTLDGSS